MAKSTRRSSIAVGGVALLKAEDNSPVGAHGDAPIPREIAFQWGGGGNRAGQVVLVAWLHPAVPACGRSCPHVPNSVRAGRRFRKGVLSRDVERAHMQHAAFGVHLVEFYSASLRHAQAMTEHEKQQATVADFVPSALGRFNQAFNLARREMLPLANLCQHPPASVPRRSSSPCRTPRFSPFWRVDHFVESLPCPMPRKPA